MKYTDEQIIKALERCEGEDGISYCNKCILYEYDNCVHFLSRKARELINCQKAEIERLNTELTAMRSAANSYKMHYEKAEAEIEKLKEENKKQKSVIEEIEDIIKPLPFETDFDKAIKTAKSEAIKKFAERLKRSIVNILDCKVVFAQNIDNLLEEMEKENE